VIGKRLCCAVLFAAGCANVFAQVHPFEPPPRLKELTAPGAKPSPFALQAQQPQTCDPAGSISRTGDIVTVQLDFKLGQFTINNPDPTDPYKGEDPVSLRSYGGCKAGPVIDVLPGNTLRFNLVNNLDANDPSCGAFPSAALSLPPGVGCFNTTNLHTHGLHVSPAGNSDNVLLSIAPQTAFPYEINIPKDHPAGTFWYHAHNHGSTAVQVASGASGALIIRGDRPYTPPTPENPHPQADIDTILHDEHGVPFKEQLFLFQQIAYACFRNDPSLAGGSWQQIYTTKGIYDINTDGSKPDSPANAPWVCPTQATDKYASVGAVENFTLQLDSPSIWDTNGRFTSVNGVVQPTMEIPAGEIQRWRFIHAGIHDTVNLQIVRAAPPHAGSASLIATSALRGNREQQAAEVASDCPDTPQALLPQFEIASDGLTRTKIRNLSGASVPGSVGSNYLQPGYRSDILVVFPEEGDYCLLNQAAPASERPHNGNDGGQGPSQAQLLAYIHVRGGHAVTQNLQTYIEQRLYAANPQLPERVRHGLLDGDITPWAPFVELPAPPAENIQHADFNISSQGFTINGVSYDPEVVNIQRQVNTLDRWLLTSQGEPHIFHIHVNPVEVMNVEHKNKDGQWESIFNENGNCKPSMVDEHGLQNQYCGMYHVFRDTVFVQNDYRVDVRTFYDRYIGEFVMHCHILDHEDSGMMMNIEIVPDLKAPHGGLGMSSMKHMH
jgi:FtsP/CotA-like multicopper oxidase with cupredoxin domain